MKGWQHFFKIFASVTAYFRCFLNIKSFFLRTFIAKTLPSSFFLTKNTFPKVPEPNNLKISKESNLAFWVIGEFGLLLGDCRLIGAGLLIWDWLLQETRLLESSLVLATNLLRLSTTFFFSIETFSLDL